MDHRPSERLAARRRLLRRRPVRKTGHPILKVISITLVVLLALLATGVTVVGVAAVVAVERLSEGLPDPHELEDLSFAQPTIVLDRTGTVELARFQQEQRS